MRIDLLNAIADGLNECVKDGDFAVYSNYANDEKFPIYINYSIHLISKQHGLDISHTMRIHGREMSSEGVMRKLAAKLVAELLQLAASGRLGLNDAALGGINTAD